jgi:hypothetical protein
MNRFITGDNFSNADIRRLRQFSGVRTTRELINLAGNDIDIGVRPATQRRRALNYWREFYNDAVTQVREGYARERRERNRSNSRVDRMIRKLRNAPISDREMPFTLRNNREGLRLLNGVRGLRYLIKSGNVIVTITPQNVNNLIEAFERDGHFTQVEAERDSWGGIVYNMVEGNENLVFTRVEEGNLIAGSFFSYKHNITSLDLTRQQIYYKDHVTTVEKDSCFIHALEMYGVKNLDNVRHIISKRELPMHKIKKVAEMLNLHITVRRVEDCKNLKHYGDKSLNPINLGLIENHYFLIERTNVTSYALKFYETLKHLDRWNEVKNIRPNGFPHYDRSKFASSFDVVKILLENKEKLLTPIPQEELYASHYYQINKEITSLDFDNDTHLSYLANKYSDKTNERALFGEYKNIFFDYETNTEGTHTEYLCRCSCFPDRDFIGEDCGKKMLYALVAKFPSIKNLRLIAHNAAYDFRFLMKHLCCIEPITRGKMLLKADARFYIRKGEHVNIEIQDSYALIPSKLADFGDMFKLDVCKEILPYGLFTKENIERRFISGEECVEACKKQYRCNNIGTEKNARYRLGEKQFVRDFFANVNNWGCNNRFYGIDIIKYSSIYCKMDCEVLEKGYNTFRSWILEACELDIDNYISLPSLANAYLTKEGVYEGVCQVSCVVRDFIQRAMIGGRTMCAENKKHHIKNQPLDDFDAVSLYPSAMKRLGGYLLGNPKMLETTSYSVLQTYDGYFVEIEVTKVGKHYKFPLMSVRNDKGIRNFTNDMVGKKIVVDKITLEDLIKFQKVEFKIIRGYYYNEGRNLKLAETIEYLFQQRLNAKKVGNPIQAVYKLLMNSAYGKTLLKPFADETKFIHDGKKNEFMKYVAKHYNEIKEIIPLPNGTEYIVKQYKSIDQHYNNCACGVEVLSMSKRIMNEVMCLAEDIGIDIYYQDTDSMHIDTRKVSVLSDVYREMYGRDLIGKEMGQFHTDFDSKIIKGDIVAKESIFLGKKCYLDVLQGEDGTIDYHIRMKGVSSAAIYYYAEQNNTGLEEIYSRLYNGEKIEFDLCCGGDACAFEFHKNMTISSRERFVRQICF